MSFIPFTKRVSTSSKLRLTSVALLLFVVLVPIAARAQLTNIQYTTQSDGNGGLIITAFSASGTGPVTIPGTINNLPVTGIGYEAFYGRSYLTGVTIPYGVTSIASNAFVGAPLTSVSIPNSVTTIGADAFSQCPLIAVNIPASVTSIAILVFNDCTSLTSITVDPANTVYSSSADGVLFDKQQTTLIQYPVGKVGAYTIPNSVTSIARDAFDGCGTLTSITIPNSVTSIGAGAFAYCADLSRLTIPASVTNIGDLAFAYCSIQNTGLYTVVFQGNAPTMGQSVFLNGDPNFRVEYYDGATGFTSPTWNDGGGDSYPAIDLGDGSGQLTNIQYTTQSDGSGGLVITGFSASGSGSLTIPGTINNLPVTGIGDSAFYARSYLTGVIIPDSVTSIAGLAFTGANLTSVTIGAGVTSIGFAAFSGCPLTTVNLPASVTNLGSYVFNDCTSLTSITVDPANPVYSSSADGVLFDKQKANLIQYPVGKVGAYTIPSSVTHISHDAFNNCRTLPSVIIPASVTGIDSSVFYYCVSLTTATFQGNAPTMSSSVFLNTASNFTVDYYDGATGFTSPTWNDGGGDTYAAVDLGSFAPLTNIQYTTQSDGNGGLIITGFSANGSGPLTIPDTINSLNVTGIGSDAFAFSDLTGVTLPANLTSIAGSAFANCASLTNVTISGSVASIGVGAFANCTSLAKVVIPSSVTSIGNGAFNGCTHLTRTIFQGNAPSIGTGVFTGTASGFAVGYYDGATGFTSSTWNGYPSVDLGIANLNGNPASANLAYSPWFGYYFTGSYPLVYEYNLGYEYVFSATNGVYLYDYTSGHFWYTQSSYYPYVYDFTLGAYLYYYVGNGNPRYFYQFGSNHVISE